MSNVILLLVMLQKHGGGRGWWQRMGRKFWKMWCCATSNRCTIEKEVNKVVWCMANKVSDVHKPAWVRPTGCLQCHAATASFNTLNAVMSTLKHRQLSLGVHGCPGAKLSLKPLHSCVSRQFWHLTTHCFRQS